MSKSKRYALTGTDEPGKLNVIGLWFGTDLKGTARCCVHGHRKVAEATRCWEAAMDTTVDRDAREHHEL